MVYRGPEKTPRRAVDKATGWKPILHCFLACRVITRDHAGTNDPPEKSIPCEAWFRHPHWHWHWHWQLFQDRADFCPDFESSATVGAVGLAWAASCGAVGLLPLPAPPAPPLLI